MKTVPVPCRAWPTIAEAAAELDVTPGHVRDLAKRNRLSSVTLTTDEGRSLRIDPTSITEYLAQTHLPERRASRLLVRPELLEILPPETRREGQRGPIRGTRYPLRPLRVLMEMERDGVHLSFRELAVIFETSPTAVARAHSDGLNESQADRWAVLAGYHPGLVWLDGWWTAWESQERTNAMRRHPSYRAVAEHMAVAA